jgi:hypothetical protein
MLSSSLSILNRTQESSSDSLSSASGVPQSSCRLCCARCSLFSRAVRPGVGSPLAFLPSVVQVFDDLSLRRSRLHSVKRPMILLLSGSIPLDSALAIFGFAAPVLVKAL